MVRWHQCWVLMILCAAGIAAHSPVRFAHGVHFKRIRKPIATSSIAVKFVMDLKAHALDSMENLDHLQAHLLRAGVDMAVHINRTCDLMRQTHGQISSHYLNVQSKSMMMRAKRFSNPLNFIGELLGFCCNVATSADLELLVDNDINIQAQIDQIADSVDALVNVTRENTIQWANFAENVRDNFHKIDQLLTDLVNSKSHYEDWFTHVLLRASSSITEMVLKLLMAERLENIYSDCSDNKIPRAAIDPDVLTNEITKINAELKGHAEVAVHSVAALYKLKIAACAIDHDETLTIMVKIPLIKPNSNLELFDAVPVPFSYNGHTCNLLREPTLIMVSRNEIKILSSSQRTACLADAICQIPRETMSHTKLGNCLLSLLKTDVSIETLKQKCQFDCVPYRETVIRQLENNQYVIVHPRSNLKIVCPTTAKTVPSVAIGASRIDLPCECVLREGTDVIISTLFPCDRRLAKLPSVVTLLPGLWSKVGVSHSNLVTGDMEFESVKSVLSTNLSLALPNLQLPVKRDTTKKPLNVLSNTTPVILYSMVALLMAWTAALTVVTVVLCFKLKSVTSALAVVNGRPRPRPSPPARPRDRPISAYSAEREEQREDFHREAARREYLGGLICHYGPRVA